PFGIYVMIGLLALLALLNALEVIALPSTSLQEIFSNPQLFLFLAVNVAVVAFCIILAVGLWRLVDKAWYAAMITCVLYLFFNIWRYLNGGHPYLIMLLMV